MHEWSLKYLRCVSCHKKLELEKITEQKEITEGFLLCSRCNISYPIICKVPILWNNLTAYLTRRVALGGWMMLHTSPKMKKFVKNSLSQIKKTVDDSSRVEKNWVRIYQNSKNSKFYTTVRKITDTLPKSEFALEHGCSIGLISAYLAKNHTTVFGIDSSYSSILHAKKSKKQNLDFFVADSLEHPFGSKKFGLVVALNLLELVEPTKLLKTISTQIQNGTVLFSDPYDYERGINSVKNPIFENEIRNKLIHLGFSISPLTKKPSFIQWNLNLNSRASLYYKVDLILGKKN